MSWREATMTINCFIECLVSRNDGQSVTAQKMLSLDIASHSLKSEEELLQCAEVVSFSTAFAHVISQ